jgi:hypothetical protein
VHIVNFEGLAQASAATIEWPIVDQNQQPFVSIDAAKLEIASQSLTLGNGLTFNNSTISADLNNARTATLVGVVNYELWVQIGPDKIAVVRGTMDFTKTKVRI